MDEQELAADAEAEADARESGALLFIGLIVLLIGFFIVLNHASSVAGARSRAVMGSVAATFASVRPDASGAEAFTTDLGNVPQAQTLRQRLGKLITTAFPLARVTETSPGEIYEVKLPVSSMWTGNDVVPSDAGRKFLARVASILATPPKGTVYRAEAWLNSRSGSDSDRAIRRISNLANALVAAGAPAGDVDSGLSRGTKATLRLVFSVHSATGAAQ